MMRFLKISDYGFIIKDYLNNTTIHGLKYFVQPGRHWLER
jgi:hypothetical protein